MQVRRQLKEEPVNPVREMTEAFTFTSRTVLTIVGKRPEKANLQNLASDLGVSTNVSFIGEVDDDTLASLRHSSAAVVLPSYSEVFDVAILEAFAANGSVVATSTVGAMSVVTDRVSGRIAPFGDSEAVADAIADLFSNYEAAVEMAEVGHQLAVSKYSIEAVTESLERLYQSEAPPRIKRPENTVTVSAIGGVLA